MTKLVLDTSVAVKWFSEHDEGDLNNALKLRTEILEGTVFVMAPDLLFYELANALRYNPSFSPGDVLNSMQSVWDMGIEVKAAEIPILKRAAELAFKFNVAVYDACFLAFAQQEDCSLVTADYKFIRRLKKIKNVVKLSDLY